MLTINQFCAKTGLSKVYVHRMILDGKIKSEKRMIPNTNIPRNEIEDGELDRFLNRTKHTKREDGRSRFVLHATSEELQKIQELLESNELGAQVSKQKYYHSKK